MSLNAYVKSIQFNGEKVDFEEGEIVIITGPNNAGKSQFLRDVYSQLRGDNIQNIVANNVEFRKDFSGEDLLAEIKRLTPTARDGASFQAFGTMIHPFAINNIVEKPFGIADLFCYFAHTGVRLQEVGQAPAFDRRAMSPELPIQRMYIDDRLEDAISRRFRIAFDQDIIVNRSAGSVIPIYIGERPDWTKENDRLSIEYAEKIEKLKRLDEQGDGMKAFAGLLFRIMAYERSILLIDEPEAFLHPPQARLIGRLLAEERLLGKQVFVSTHSSDFIQGVIEARPEKIRLARLSRRNNTNLFNWLNPEKTKQFLQDTLLRTSNILSGLFHDKVVLCEGDRDAVFYKEILKSLCGDKNNIDALFINTNGKDRMPDFSDALAEMGVNTIIIADIDLIRSFTTLEKLIMRRNQSNTDALIQKCRIIVDEVNQRHESVSTKSLKENIESDFSQIPDLNRPVSRDTINRIQSRLNILLPFASVKRIGHKALPPGDCQRRYKEVETALREINIWLVPEGEVEGFLRSGKRKGREWINDALERDFVNDADLKDARLFISRIFSLGEFAC